MAAFTQAGNVYAGQKTPVTVNGGASPVALTDTLVLNGVKFTMSEWIKRGCLDPATVVGNVNTYTVINNPRSV